MRNNCIFGFWIITYLLILMVPLTIYSVLAAIMSSALEKQTEEYLHARLFQMMQYVDGRLSEVDNLVSDVMRNGNVQALESKSNQNTPSFYYTLSQTRDDLYSMQSYFQYISYFYIFFHNGEFTMTPSSYMPPDDLFAKLHQQENYTAEQWLSLMKTQDFTGYVWMPARSSPEQMVYIAALRDRFFSPSSATLVVLLNIEGIEEELRESFDGNFKIIADGRSLIDLKPEYPLEKEGIYQLISPKTGWQYVYDPSPADGVHRSIIMISNCILIFCAALGVAAAVWCSVRSYQPLKALLAGKGAEGLRYREYIQIYDTIQHAEQQQAKLKDDLKTKQNEFRSLFLWRLLTSKNSSSERLRKDGELLGFDGAASYIIVLLTVRYMTVQPQRSQTLDFLISDSVERVFGREKSVVVTKINDSFCCMLPFCQPRGGMKASLTLLYQELVERYALDCLITSSEAFEELSLAYRAYGNALDMMRYCSLSEGGRIMMFEESRNPESLPAFHSKLEEPLLRSIKVGDRTDALNYLNQLFDEWFGGPPASESVFPLWLNGVLSLLARAIEESCVSEKDQLLTALSKAGIDGKDAGAEALHQELAGVVDRTCELVYAADSGRTLSLYEQIMDYVKMNYQNCDLSVSAIAYEFALNPTYLSNLFKSRAGVGLLTYINQVRIDKSVEFLTQGDSVGEAARKSGFASDNTYIKVFKKYLGITPGDYKKTIRS